MKHYFLLHVIMFLIIYIYSAGQKSSPHFFVLSRVLKLRNINLIRLYIWIAKIEYYIWVKSAPMVPSGFEKKNASKSSSNNRFYSKTLTNWNFQRFCHASLSQIFLTISKIKNIWKTSIESCYLIIDEYINLFFRSQWNCSSSII